MTVNPNELLKKLDGLSFNSLDKLGVDWRGVLKDNPEIQKEYYKFLSVRKDWVIVNLDFSQIEAYMLASLSGDNKLITAVNAGLDLHQVNTENLYHLNYNQILEDVKTASNDEELKKANEAVEYFKTKRKATKSFTFSISYGAGKEKISMDLRIPINEADKLLKNFYATYPKIREWQGNMLSKAIKEGYLETPFGRRRATPALHGRTDAYDAFIKEDEKVITKLKKAGEYWSLRNEFKQVLNTNIQSTSSDMCSLSACKFKEWLKIANKRAELYFWVHDSNVLACHIDDAVEVIDKLMDIMENQVKYDNDPVNYRTSIEVGFSYEWVSEIKRSDWINSKNKQELIMENLDKALDLDKEKKFKMVVKSSSTDMANFEKYIKQVKLSKEDYFNKIVEGLGLDGISSPEDYMCQLNGCSTEEYEQAMGLDGEDLIDDED